MSNWISIEDKLPDEEGHYLTFNGYHYAIQTWNENGWLRLYDAKSITHWQKLPEPPKGVDYE